LQIVTDNSISLAAAQVRAAWLHAQGLDVEAPFGRGPEATRRVVEHLGSVQIDTINVIDRSHHHVLYTRPEPPHVLGIGWPFVPCYAT
jgi:uncharacterized protein